MTLPHIETGSRRGPQPVPDNLLGHYAGFISRFLAFLVDTVIISLVVVSVTWFVQITFNTFRVGSFLGISPDMIPGSRFVVDFVTSPVVAGLVTILFILTYHVFFWVFAGQTPGKALSGLRLVTSDGKRIPPLRASLRFLAYFISALPFFLGFIWVLVDDRRQAWHDKIARTCVVYTWAARPDERFLQAEIRQVTQAGSNSLPAGDQSQVESPSSE